MDRGAVGDYTQISLYNILFDIKFGVYMVFDWSSKIGHKIICVNNDINHKEKPKDIEARNRLNEALTVVRKTATDIEGYAKFGWSENPCKENCDNCPVLYCGNNGKVFER